MQVRRLRDAAMRGLRAPEWGSELGRLLLTGSITEEMYAAGLVWADQAQRWRSAIGVFPVRSSSLELGIRGSSPDPESPEGQRIARREADQAERFFAAHAALMAAGMLAESAVCRVCEKEEALVGMMELIALRRGLSALVRHYALTKTRKSA